ncbi:MAG TPA: FAD-binding oxidoreductase [Dongiaceae bacterium]|jgi:glycine/D-amino acid oxidase-like deaminating enzyme
MTSPDSVFAHDYKNSPYWWEAAPRPQLAESDPPAKADVAIVGSGYTGLCAAIETARGGRQTLVFDAEDAGWGCSTRNGGQVSFSLKPGFEELAARHGNERALAILQEGHNALAWIERFIADEGIDCGFARVGRFHAAHNAVQYESLARRLQTQQKGLEQEAHMVPRAEQRTELGSDAYYGGAVYLRHASLDPALYHQGLLDRAVAAGASIHPRCPVTAIERDGDGFRVATPRGAVRVRDVILATNGYTGAVTPWFRRRVIPIGSYIIATEPLAPELMAKLMPKNRVVSDTRKLVYYYRASPDRRRILFGGRVAYKETDPKVSAPRLHAELARLFPELSGTKVSHSWMGFVAYTFDTMPHVGRRDGIYYAMGYCGSGISLASYFGMRVGRQLLGLKDGATPLDGLAYPTRPYYWGNPWFLAAAIRYYRWHDRQNR